MARGVTRTVILGLLLSAGCTPLYQEGSFTDYGRADEPRMRAFDCLDVRLQPRGGTIPGRRWVAIDFDIGNRCNTPVEVDFRAITVFAEDSRSVERLRLYDPRAEVIAATLDGRGYASEALAYESEDGVAARLRRVCVDVSGLASGDSATPICFRREGEALRVESGS
jgi:hypothetical protein